MAQLPERWITDTTASPRFPHYTRANADEVGPEPFSPLGWSLGWVRGCIPGVADGFVGFGILGRDEFAVEPPEVFGNWGGYFYNQLSITRLMGERMPGASWRAIDEAYFGDHPGIPPYEAHPDDENEAQSARLAETMAWAMSTGGDERLEAWGPRAEQVRRDRPDLGALPDGELVARARDVVAMVAEAWGPHCEVLLACSLGPGALTAICAERGRPGDALALITAIGGVESAETSVAVWVLSRLVRGSRALTAEFDRGVEGLLERIGADSSDDAATFRAELADLLAEHGHRGPNEWDLSSPSWETDPAIVLGMIERLRLRDDSAAPRAAAERNAAERRRVSAEVQSALDDDEAVAAFRAALRSSEVFLRLRELGKNAIIKLLHEAKLPLLELGRRMVERGGLDEPRQVFMLLDDEVDAFLDDPGPMADELRDRSATFAGLGRVVPPYIVSAPDGPPPLSEWPVRGSRRAESAGAGEVLAGTPVSPGRATGTARVVLDPYRAEALQPGDVMVAPTTDPSWTPLFMSAGAVVCNVGAVASHAAIVSRELGVPCALSVHDATDRIPDGATVTVDGSTGTVTIDALP